MEKNTMTHKAKAFIGCTALAGMAVLAAGFLHWESPNPARFAVFLLLGLLASAMKVRLPGITGTMSVSFLFILIGVAECTLSETLAVGCLSVLVQSFWKAQRRPSLVQVLFNVASHSLSIAAAYWAARSVVDASGMQALPLMLAVAASIFFVANTGLVSAVLSLTGQKPLKSVWQHCLSCVLPYYLAGAALAGLVIFTSRTIGWVPSLMALPVMYLMYVYYRLYVERMPQEQS